MQAAVIGAGPTGLFTAVALARRGHRVTVVDRDPGPAPDGTWPRRGVMQFHHPHGVRQQVVQAIQAELPEVENALLAAGAERSILPAADGRPAMVVGLHCRRMLFERVLRETATAEPGVTFVRGHAEDVLRSRGRAAGLRVDGGELEAGLVVNASGRSGRIAGDLRAPAAGGDCGMSYVSRHYALRPGAEPGPVNAPLGLITRFPGYLAGVFLQDNRTVSVLIARLTGDRELAGLRQRQAFDAAVRVIPGLAEWTEPDRTEPMTPVLAGARLHNTYRGQLDAEGNVALPGLVHLGDAVCTTNPTAGRGIATSLMQARQFVRTLNGDVESATVALDEWCTTHIRPWFDDHVAWDADEIRQWAGEDVDLSRPLTSGHVVAAAQADPSLMRVVGPYLSMRALPATLAEVEPRAREIYAGGWRPPVPQTPTRDELAALIRRTTALTV
ncbi:FAD-dependent oxidoreductase [Actinoplanes sp. NPDC049548]|uniref:FAD-dependent oxidoreductase n=1 Tax=Actinoplanes sp. NPDC049548 TaxID=3155152 RepID=UPI003448EDA2